ncbi:hypothetical protein [Neptuniibacter halophilus]|nr:hypothetical protein [Neptuniibacter halophilus]
MVVLFFFLLAGVIACMLIGWIVLGASVIELIKAWREEEPGSPFW